MKKKIIAVILLFLIAVGVRNINFNQSNVVNSEEIENSMETIKEKTINNLFNTSKLVVEKEKHYEIAINDEGQVIYNPGSSSGYNYGPSIIINDDGSIDAWFSSPGNNGSQWDWIRYRHSEDGINWSNSEVVLKPTPGSLDSCSVCDPGVIFFNDYYYLAYTGTNDASRNGYNNSAFVARSKNPDGPFEKWNGEGWGGSPVPMIEFTGDPSDWGIGEVSFVVKDDDLYIYSTFIGAETAYIDLRKADLVDDWPSTVRYKRKVCYRPDHDSIDVAYIEDLDMFFAFSINKRMQEKSELILLTSKNGNEFTVEDTERDFIKNYAHNLGVGKSKEGHIQSIDDIIVGYAYGKEWGRWSTIIQHISVIEE